MSQKKKNPQPDIDLDAEAKLALSEAMKKAGIIRNAAAKRGIAFPKRGRPYKN